MKYIFHLIFFIISMSLNLNAIEIDKKSKEIKAIELSSKSASTRIKIDRPNERGDMVLQTISKLEKAGYITRKNSIEAKKEFVFDNKELMIEIFKEAKIEKPKNDKIDNEFSFTEYMTILNFIYMFAIILLLIAFKGFIFEFMRFFAYIPQIIYQSLLGISSIYLTFFSSNIEFFGAEAIYVSIFAVFSNIIIATWVFSSYKELFLKLIKLFYFEINTQMLISLYCLIYFGFFTIFLESQFIGLFAALSLISLFSFFFISTGLTTYLGYKDDRKMGFSYLISGSILVGYSIINILNINLPYLSYFSVGIEYVISISFVLAFLINLDNYSSKYTAKNYLFNLLFFTLVSGFFAIYLNSPFVGIATIFSFLTAVGFFIYTTPLSVTIGYKDFDSVKVGLFITGSTLALYSTMLISGIEIPYINVFSTGIEYFVSITYIIALLISSSFVNYHYSNDREEKGYFFFVFSILLMIITFGLSMFSLVVYNLPVIPYIMNTGFFFFILGWISFLSSKLGGILISLIGGLTLLGIAKLLENYPEYFITQLF